MISFTDFTELKSWAVESPNRLTFIYACDICISSVEKIEEAFENKEFSKIFMNDFLNTAPEGISLKNQSKSFFRLPIATPTDSDFINEFIGGCK